jgi:hypothetical protein
MVKVELTFAAPSMCEGVRLTARLGGFEISENKISRDDITAQNIQGYKATVDGKEFKQGPTVFRLLGALATVDGAHLYPSDPLKALEVDNAIEEIRDLRQKVTPCLNERDPSRREAAIEKLKNEALPATLPTFETIIKRGGGAYLTGNNMSIADLEIFGTLVWITQATDLKAYPAVNKLYETLNNHAGLKAAKAKL